MTKHILFFCLWLTGISPVVAQDLFRATILDEESKQPLPGVNFYFPILDMGGVSDVEGEVSIAGLPTGTHRLQISFVGYETLITKTEIPQPDSLQRPVYYLHHTHDEMETIVISSTRSSRSIEDIPTRVEFIAGEELAEKGNMKPGDIRMLLNESTGIRTQQTSATSYNSSIRIQGLDGRYTLLLRDELPLYSGYSAGLSLMQIAPLDLKQVEVIKGATSTLYGGGAIAGLVNLVSKKPEAERELGLMLNGTSALGLDVSGFYSQRYGKVGTTVFASYNKGTAYDPADIGLTAIPKFDRITLNPHIYLYPNEKTEIDLGVNYIKENRLGGNMDYIQGNAVSNPYFESNKTDRLSSQFHLSHLFSSSAKLVVKNSINVYDRSIEIPGFTFSGRQLASFSEVNYVTFNSKLEWVTGLNLWTDRFEQFMGSPNQDLGFANATIGAFIQNIWNMSDRWVLESGFRADYQSDYGFFPLPRVSLMYEPTATLTLRLGGGLGYKIPTTFTEDAERIHFQNLLPINPDDFVAEKSYGGNFDINYRWAVTKALSLSFNALLFYTRIQDPLVLSPVANNYEYEQPNGYVDTKGVEMNMKWAYQDFKLFIGYTYANVNEHYNGNSTPFPLVAKHRLNNVLMYEKHGNFWIGLEAYYFSPQLLNDGSVGRSYWIAGLMTEKTLGENVSLFLNFENFTDTRQTSFGSIYSGDISDPQFMDIYAPLDGFVVNGGIKLKL